MNNVLIKQAVLSLLILVSISACAQEPELEAVQSASLASTDTIVLSDDLIEKFQANTRLSILNVEQSPLDNLYQITTDRGIFYLSKDGQYFINAVIFNLDKGMLNETDIAMNGIRLQKVSQIRDSGIVYKAQNEKYIVDVFTDITCGYCRKLHREMQDYLDAGISIRYLAYPREGLNGDVYKQMRSIWCSADPQEAMDNAKAGDSMITQTCPNNIATHYQTGASIGVTGTPNIVLADGSLIGGYQPAQALLAELKKRLGE